MKRKLFPSQQRALLILGDQIRMARLRRDFTTEQVAERSGIGRSTLVKIEKGDEGVSIGMYYRVLLTLGLGDDITLLAKDDVLGRKIQDAKIDVRQRASKK
ncbi:MAG: helix-turn-helix domain-containing protein [Bacteroidia bacterium]|nr:helix-turn-helix domain-containing protein [Bacteroidia bacterium]